MAIISIPVGDATGTAGRTARAGARTRRRHPVATVLVPLDLLALVAALTLRGESAASTLGVVGVALPLLAIGGTYRRRLCPSLLDDLPRLVVPILIALAAVVVLPGMGDRDRVGISVAFGATALVVGRAIAYESTRWRRRRGAEVRNTVVVGAGAIGLELHRLLGDHPEYGLRSVGLIDDVDDTDPVPLLGGLDDLGRIVHQRDATVVIVAFGPTAEQEMIATLRHAVSMDVDVYVVPRFFELGLAPNSVDIEQIWGIPVYRARRAALTTMSWRVKRFCDVVVSATMLLLLGPLLGALALAVRFTSPGPILFRQVRVGQHGRPIEVLKFRSMRVNDDSDVKWTVSDDPRLTPIGRWLRRLSLDELPQLWNVLAGDMSLIGPRPERPHFVETFRHEISGYGDRHRLPVGLTGLAQIHGLRGDTSIAERARFDNYYIEHWSPWHDMKIVVRTATSVVRDAFDRDR
jgi:exopolysaccharide biosynthesis polyprenyl glycosylphosphotransferase